MPSPVPPQIFFISSDDAAGREATVRPSVGRKRSADNSQEGMILIFAKIKKKQKSGGKRESVFVFIFHQFCVTRKEGNFVWPAVIISHVLLFVLLGFRCSFNI